MCNCMFKMNEFTKRVVESGDDWDTFYIKQRATFIMRDTNMGILPHCKESPCVHNVNN